MSFASVINRNIKEYGTVVTFSPDGENYGETYMAFIQPLRYKNKMYLEGKHSDIGVIDSSYSLYIGPPEIDVTVNTVDSRLKMGGKTYHFTHAESVRIGDETAYMWGVVRKVFDENS